MNTPGIFDDFLPSAYPYRYEVELVVGVLAGGVPTDPKVAEGWLKTKLGLDKGEELRAAVAQTMAERGVAAVEAGEEIPDDLLDDAVAEVVAAKQLNGFKRMDGPGSELCIEGRHVKAMLKEAANIRWAKERWGPTSKGTRSFFAEHVFVAEPFIGLGVTEPSDIHQRFVHTWRGSGIQYEEVVVDAHVAFTVYTDTDFDSVTGKGDVWPLLWLTAQSNGLGASRSQGYGTFKVTKFERVK